MDNKLTEGMADMKMTAKDREHYVGSNMPSPQYSYGLSIRLENDTLEKLGIKSLPAPGECFVIHAMAESRVPLNRKLRTTRATAQYSCRSRT